MWSGGYWRLVAAVPLCLVWPNVAEAAEVHLPRLERQRRVYRSGGADLDVRPRIVLKGLQELLVRVHVPIVHVAARNDDANVNLHQRNAPLPHRTRQLLDRRDVHAHARRIADDRRRPRHKPLHRRVPRTAAEEGAGSSHRVQSHRQLYVGGGERTVELRQPLEQKHHMPDAVAGKRIQGDGVEDDQRQPQRVGHRLGHLQRLILRRPGRARAVVEHKVACQAAAQVIERRDGHVEDRHPRGIDARRFQHTRQGYT